MRLKFVVVALAAVLVMSVSSLACGKVTPQSVVANVSNSGALVIQSVDLSQKFIIEQEAAGRIPRNEARAAMTVVQRILVTTKDKVIPYLDQLNKVPTLDAAKPVLAQLQDALRLVSSDVVQILIPIKDEGTREQLGKLATGIADAITKVNDTIFAILAAKGGATAKSGDDDAPAQGGLILTFPR